MSAARAAIDRFVYDLLTPDDELFFMQFANRPQVVQSWTNDRRAISRAVSRVLPAGGTALADAIADGVPLADVGAIPEGAAGNLRRKRHEQPHLHRRTAQPDQRERGARIRPWVSTAPPVSSETARPFSCPFRSRSQSRAAPAEPTPSSSNWRKPTHADIGARQRECAPRHHRRHRRPHRDRPGIPRPGRRDDPAGRRVQQAVLSWLREPPERRTGGGTISGWW